MIDRVQDGSPSAGFAEEHAERRRVLYVVNEAYFFLSHRAALADGAMRSGYDVHVAAPIDHVWAPDGFDIGELELRGYRVHPIRLSRRGQNPFGEVRTLADIWRVCRRVEPHVIHLLTIKPILYGGFVARALRVPVVIAAFTGLGHTFSSTGISAALRRNLTIPLLRSVLAPHSVTALFQSRADMQRMNDLAVVPQARSALVQGSGVDLNRFVPHPIAAGPPLVVLCARLIWEKGVREFVDAAARVHETMPEARFALVGDTQGSNPRSVPLDRLQEWQAAGHIEWWGRRDDMPDVLRQASVVCLPSSYGEGVPRILLEAAAAGRPIVASDIGGCREIVRHEVNGLLVEPGDTDALAGAILRLLRDRDALRGFGHAGRLIAEREFSESHVVSRTLELYKAVRTA